MKLDKIFRTVQKNYELFPLVSFVTVAFGYGAYRLGWILTKDPDVHLRKKWEEREQDEETFLPQY